MKRWSKLQHELRNVFVPGLKLDVQCRVYRTASQRGSELPRYWVSLRRETIWDYPKDFAASKETYPYVADVSDISDLLREYIDTPRSQLLHRTFGDDRWGITDVLKAADRRLGLRRLEQMQRDLSGPAQKVLAARSALTSSSATQRSAARRRRARPNQALRRTTRQLSRGRASRAVNR
jgi:hypothetical protein